MAENNKEELEKLWNMSRIRKLDISHLDYSFLPKIVQDGEPRQIVWHLINDINNIVCCECGNSVKWTRKFNAYRTYCSSKCANSNLNKKEKIKATNLERYGTEYASQNSTIKEKVKTTNLERYGVENPTQNKEIRQKVADTIIARYGVEHALQNSDIQEKIKKTNLERYGVEFPQQNEEIREKSKQSMMERYGVENPFQHPEISDKIKQTNLERYGTENPSGIESIRNKIKQTNLERYGVENPIQNPDIREKVIQTNLERYGVEYHQYKHITEKSLEIIKNKVLFDNYIRDKTIYEVASGLGIDNTTVYEIIKKYDSKDLYKKSGPSTLEAEMIKFLDSINVTYEINNKTILQGYEIDFYIPEFMLAIEMNGLYWHTDAKRPDPKYHYNKWKLCEKLGIHLVSIFEDVWNLQNDIIQNILLSHFKMKNNGIPARKTTIKQIDATISRPFLEKYHIQGFVGGTHFGAFDNNDALIAVMTFGYTRNHRFELKRFVMDNYNHPGMFSKLFKYAQNELQFDEVVSFSDNNWFTGNVYSKNGFDFIQVIDQDYKYLVNKKQEHKSNYKKENIKKKFPHMAEAIDNGLSETAAMEYLNIPKVYDCGKKEWIWRK